MQRITLDDDAVLDGSGNPVFADSNPPLPDTIITAAWLNSVQEELAHLVTDAGQTLNPADPYQVSKAIRDARAILTNTTLTVNGSAPYPKLADAFEALRGRHIGSGVVVTIQLTATTHTQNQPLFITHPQGERIIIKGNDADPTTTILSVTADLWTAEQAAICVEAGGRLGGMSGFQIVMNTSGTPPTVPTFGLKASSGGRMKLGNVQVLNWRGSNIIAQSGGVIIADGTFANNAVDPYTFAAEYDLQFGHNWHARDTGVIIAKNTTCSLATEANYLVETGGVMRLQSCTAVARPIVSRRFGVMRCFLTTARSNIVGGAGFSAQDCGEMYCDTCTSGGVGTGNGVGFQADAGSRIYAQGCTASYNTSHGFNAETGSIITGSGNTSSNNTGWGYFLGNFCYIQSVSGGTGNTLGLANITAANAAKVSMVG